MENNKLDETFILAVYNMRKVQSKYFYSRNKVDLNYAIKYEKLVDSLMSRYTEIIKNNSLPVVEQKRFFE